MKLISENRPLFPNLIVEKYKVNELKKEVAKVKKGFQASKLKRAQVVKLILDNRDLFLHFFEDADKIRPLIKTVVDPTKNKRLKGQLREIHREHNMLLKMKPKLEVKKPESGEPKEQEQKNNTNIKDEVRAVNLALDFIDEIDEKARKPENSGPIRGFARLEALPAKAIIDTIRDHYVIRDTSGEELLKGTKDRNKAIQTLYERMMKHRFKEEM